MPIQARSCAMKSACSGSERRKFPEEVQTSTYIGSEWVLIHLPESIQCCSKDMLFKLEGAVDPSKPFQAKYNKHCKVLAESRPHMLQLWSWNYGSVFCNCSRFRSIIDISHIRKQYCRNGLEMQSIDGSCVCSPYLKWCPDVKETMQTLQRWQVSLYVSYQQARELKISSPKYSTPSTGILCSDMSFAGLWEHL